MGPIAIAVICATVFGVISSIGAFIHQVLSSRDKRLNDLAQQRALGQETTELKKLRDEMLNFKRYNAYYQVLGENKEAVQYLDQKIEEILKKKSALIDRYSQAIIKESNAIVAGDVSLARKEVCDKLKAEIDSQCKAYDLEIEQLQKRRASLWDSHKELQAYILDQEKKRNEHMDAVYQQHSALLEKIFLRHNENSEHTAKSLIESSTQVFKSFIAAPIEFLAACFNLSQGISLKAVQQEKLRRQTIAALQASINNEQDMFDSHSLDKKNQHDSESAGRGYPAQFSFTA